MERSLTWVTAGVFSRFACTCCAWSHPNPSSKDVPDTLDAGVFSLVRRAFSQHMCARHPFLRHTTPSSTGLDPAAPGVHARISW